ncbi:hypothetical protein FRC01_011540 [Tulasnella sp. 417]|nr:hypothetical protein FRC01_011540 [Tulasnella sp. 417]
MSDPNSEGEFNHIVVNTGFLDLRPPETPPPGTPPGSRSLPEPKARSPTPCPQESKGSSIVVIEVEGARFAFPRHILKQSDFFRDMLTSTHIGGEGEGTESNPIVLDSISQVTKFQVQTFTE